MPETIAAPRHLTSLPPLSSRDWSDTATNYRDLAAFDWDLLRTRSAARMDAYAARYSARALDAWHATAAGA